MAYIVRNATVQDVAEITRLERDSATAAHWSDQQYRTLFPDAPSSMDRLILTAVEQDTGELAGFLIALDVVGEWELENIVVHQQIRQKGIGTCLLEELTSVAQASQSGQIFLEVRESNTAARRLYEKAGFTETGLRKRYYSNPVEDAVLYRKSLR